MTGACATLSLNEVEQLCLKAARGAGMTWGLAEEAGFAAGWLAERGLDGPGSLLRRLESREPPDRIVMVPGHWRGAGGGSLCPIAVGAALCDFAVLPEAAMAGAGLQVGPVRQGLLLLPFLCGLAAMRGGKVQLDWSGGQVLLEGNGTVSGAVALLAAETEVAVHLALLPAGACGPRLAHAPVMVAAATMAGLNRLALCTTVPPSPLSRAGAGAEVDDNE